MMTNNKLTLAESGWFSKTLQNYDSNYQYQIMLFEFSPCDNQDKFTDHGEDQPLEMNVTYDVRFLTYDTLTNFGTGKYNKTELKKSLKVLRAHFYTGIPLRYVRSPKADAPWSEHIA